MAGLDWVQVDVGFPMSLEAVWCEALEGAVRWTGTPGAFWDALLRARILVREGDSVRLTLCDRYVQVLEKRQKEAERAGGTSASGGCGTTASVTR
ncbi:hypothetical protein [Cystobacter fuscus]|uniref:hypothetical protein n=1 Tax=Cystobacter fuscus TaxID=43 RepID=UPI001E3228AB|nr:hypothetical protein [Cystobacter fuscus]